MTTFSEYWKEKAQKRRKSWAAKAKRFAEQHTQLEDIRKEVYLPLGYAANFDLEDYLPLHFCEHNPLVAWDKSTFGFDEEGLLKAMEAEGANLNELAIETSHQSIRETEVPQPIIHEGPGWTPNKVWDFERKYHAWLKRVYDICTDKDTVKLTYGEVSMTINRYSREGEPFGFYELNPSEQLSKVPILMQETDFSFLNVATLLMESAAELQLRQEELNYYAKKLKIRTMEAATTDSIEFELWDDKKIQKKLKEYAVKEYSLDQVLGQVLSPWKKAVGDYMKAVTERDVKDNSQVLNARNCFYNQDFALRFVNKLRSYLNSHGLKEVRAFVPAHSYEQVVIEHKGYRVLIKRYYWPDRFAIYPYAFDDKFLETDENRLHLEMTSLTLSAIAEYLKLMPAINERMAKVIKTIKNAYGELQNKTE